MKFPYRKSFFFLFLFASFALLSIGCSGLCTVSGKVAFEDDTPLNTGTVTFQSSTYVAKGAIDRSGNYSLKVPPGEYTVFIPLASQLDTEFVAPANDPDALRYIELIDPTFASASSSPLKCSVNGRKRFDIAVNPPSK